jgi:hypothetical protein
MHEGDFPKEERKKMRNSIERNLFPAGSDDSIFCVPLHAGKKVGFLFFFFWVPAVVFM